MMSRWTSTSLLPSPAHQEPGNEARPTLAPRCLLSTQLHAADLDLDLIKDHWYNPEWKVWNIAGSWIGGHVTMPFGN